MTSLQIVGITTIIFAGGVVITAVIVLIPLVKLIKKVNQVSSKVDCQVLPALGVLNESTGKLREEVSSLDDTKDRIKKLLNEISDTLAEVKKLKRSLFSRLAGTSFEILSMFRKGRKDEGGE